MTASAAVTDLELALQLADIADGITMPRYTAGDLRVSSKPDRTPVTDADVAVEDAIRASLATERPADVVVGEERGGTAGTGRAWLLDPIDGTKNFLRGVPVWGSLIALVDDRVPVVGVASAPAMHRRWWASAGAADAGSWRRTGTGAAQACAVSGVADLADAYLSTTHLGSWSEHHSREAYLALVDACWENRAFGDFWQHCLVAEGAIELAAEPVVNPWDVAALQVIVEQAGGRFSDLSGAARFDGGTALSSNGLVHDAALAVLAGSQP